MHDRELLRHALGLTPPWEVREVSFNNADRGRPELRPDFSKGSTFSCPECGREECPAYDTMTKRWRQLDSFEHDGSLEAQVPRVECAVCGVKQIEAPWARKQSGFTLLLEAYLKGLVEQFPEAEVTFDKCHVLKLLNGAVDEVRRQEQKG